MKDLRDVALFSGLGDEALAALRSRLVLRRYRKGEIVMREGAIAESMYIIRSGQLQVVIEGRNGGPEMIITHLGPGVPVAELGPLLNERRSATVRVVIDAELWELSKDNLYLLFEEFPSLGLSISRELARRLNRTTRQPSERDELNLVAVLGNDTPNLAANLARVTGDRVMLLDVGGLRPEYPDVCDHVAVEQMDLDSEPDHLVNRLGQLVSQYDRVLIALPRHENALTRKAAEQSEVIIEMGRHSTSWVRRFARDGSYWFHTNGNGSAPQVARRLARKRVGLALSSGSVRCIAHIGVLKVLEREGIPIDMMAGTSGGGLFGGLYAAGKSIDEITDFAKGLSKISSLRGILGSGLADLNFPPRSGFIRGRNVIRFLEKSFDKKTFEQTVFPMRIVTADAITGEEVVFKSGSLAQAVRATISSVPTFDPMQIGDRWLIDGAAVNPVPASVLRDQVDILIASSVIVSLEERINRKALKQSGRLPNLWSLNSGKEEIMEAGIIQSKMGRVDAFIQPNTTQFDGLDFHRTDELIAAGIEAAEKVVGEIKSVLEPATRKQFR